MSRIGPGQATADAAAAQAASAPDDTPAIPMSYRPVPDAADAYQQVEATILRQLLSARGAFKPSPVAGGQLRAEMFIETIADAVAKGGGIGIARMLEDSLATGDAADAAEPASSTPSSYRPPVSSGFGRRSDPIDGTTKYHTGIDLRAAEGTPIPVAGEGIVRSAGPRGGYGNAIEIDHGGGLTTLYAHASEMLVKTGEKVSAGQAIVRVGQTGRATGPHLHFEVRVHGAEVDPLGALVTLGAGV
jgi:murein DD-endopeptidase MepM/ murein hydrolase activator NlpD